MGMRCQPTGLNRGYVGLVLAGVACLVAACSTSTPQSGIAVPTSTFEPGPSASYRGLVIWALWSGMASASGSSRLRAR
jgi:hypothetical protein